MKSLEYYLKAFASLNRAPGQVWSEQSKRKAPHKPILLMAVLDLVERGVIDSPFIAVAEEMVELNELFNLYWRQVTEAGQSSSIAFPFSRLSREPFWEIVPLPGQQLTPATINNCNSVTYLRKHMLGARIDDDLFALMQSEGGRCDLREALLLSCFSADAQASLREQSMVNREAFDYGRKLEEIAHSPQVKEAVAASLYRPVARDQGFRRIVVKAYDHRCALCGVRIITPEQHTAVDAAHIVPWSKSQNDDIRNGMALCKLCHWAFDRGMMGVSDCYQVILSRQIIAEPNAPGFLITLGGRGIIPPTNRELAPGLNYLASHRREWRLS